MHKQIAQVVNDIIQSQDEKVIDILPVVGNGSVNQIFIVTTGNGKLVIRLNNNRGFDEFIKEQWCIKQASQRGVLSPKVIKIAEGEGYSYMIQSFLEGTIATDTNTDKRAVWKEIGKYAKRIHSIPVSGFGLNYSEIADTQTKTSQEKWEKYVIYNIANLTPGDKLLELDVVTQEQSHKVKTLFEKLLHKKFTFGLNHGDLSLKNAIVSSQNEVSIFDWGSAEAQVVPHHDFGEILKSSLKSNSSEFKSFLSGYGLSETEYKQIEDDIHSLMLLRAIDKLRWAIDQNPTDVPVFIKNVKEKLR